MPIVTTKPISYRGGLAKFFVPRHWREEYDPEGGGTFYDERPDSGTLRLNVVTVEGRDSGAMVAHFDKRGPFETLANGLHLQRTTRDIEEDGVAVKYDRWEIAVPVPPTKLRIACFTFTVAAAHSTDAANRQDLRVIDAVIRNRATFSQLEGESGSIQGDVNS